MGLSTPRFLVRESTYLPAVFSEPKKIDAWVPAANIFPHYGDDKFYMSTWLGTEPRYLSNTSLDVAVKVLLQ